MHVRWTIRGLMIAIAAIAVVLGLASAFFTNVVQMRRLQAEARALAEYQRALQRSAMLARQNAALTLSAIAARAGADAEDAAREGRNAPQGTGGNPPASDAEKLRRENAALRARVRELEQKLGVSGAGPAPAPAPGASSSP
jgi:hypothetical protein